MQRRLAVVGIICLLAIVLPWHASNAGAESAATYALVKTSISAGGAGSSGAYSLFSSIGQPAVGQVSAGDYSLGGGFLGGGQVVSIIVRYTYLPLVRR